MTISPRTGRFSAQRRFDYRRLVAVFDTYLATGRVELSVPQTRWRWRATGLGLSSPRWLPRGRRTWPIAAWRRPRATPTAGWPAATWCSWNRRGIDCLADADGASVLAFLESLSGRWATSSLFWVVSNFRPFLTFTGRADLVDAVNLAGVKRSHPIVPVLCRRRLTAGRAQRARPGRDRRAGCGDHLAGVDDGPAGVRHRRPAAGRHRLAGTDDRHRAAARRATR